MRFLVRTQGEALRARENYDAQGAREKALFFWKFHETRQKRHIYVKIL
mgnify:CR=1 FL=1